MELDWDLYPNFSEEELACRYSKECRMHPDMMKILQNIRSQYGRPMFISSGFRSKQHPVEANKKNPGEHALGMAVDIICSGEAALKILQLAIENNIRRIGINQKGSHDRARFIHIGIADKFYLGFPKAIWTY